MYQSVAVIALTHVPGAQAPATAKGPTVTRIESRASLDGQPIDLFRLTNGHGMELEAMTYGAIITSIRVPDRSGRSGDVVLGFETLEPYLKGHPFFGACRPLRQSHREGRSN